ncbi:hypothetical protein Arad_4422 [Rhizobium rhizogenes K84]|uniref:Uncharacterized protein n=1 Tax=Rhizobium rhizogenes (strain K84 / ATCC BAA-868) TaxID=311403 RepID=B9JCM5_RHIR8|nr:hypothetical protein Arad_4422 [Rhizobium rhizogenes K84]
MVEKLLSRDFSGVDALRIQFACNGPKGDDSVRPLRANCDRSQSRR